MPTVSIYTNEVSGGWKPEDIHQSLGGGEESIVLFALTLKSLGYDVDVYAHTRQNYHGINFFPRTDFDFNKDYDILITWKDYTPWKLGVKANKKIHWSSSVEIPWSSAVLNRIDSFICFSNYHLNRNAWVGEKGKVIQLGIDRLSLTTNKTEKQKNSILYCSSPDRGLETLLDNWNRVKGCNLIITYGFKFFNQNQINYFAQKASQPNITLLGAIDKISFEKLLHSCEYWCLPLNNKDAELFCLNAVKARHTETKAIINDVENSGLTDTIDYYVPFKDFLSGKTDLVKNEKCNTLVLSWEEVVNRYWLELF